MKLLIAVKQCNLWVLVEENLMIRVVFTMVLFGLALTPSVTPLTLDQYSPCNPRIQKCR
jgi:hypothetical protein